jgi:hypothetical protein
MALGTGTRGFLVRNPNKIPRVLYMFVAYTVGSSVGPPPSIRLVGAPTDLVVCQSAQFHLLPIENFRADSYAHDKRQTAADCKKGTELCTVMVSQTLEPATWAVCYYSTVSNE